MLLYPNPNPKSKLWLSIDDNFSVKSRHFPSPIISPELDQLDQLDQEIKALENSEEYKTLARKNRAWAVPKPTEQENGEWQLLKEKLSALKKKEDFYQNAILSTNAHSVKKSDKTRKGYKKDTAVKDEIVIVWCPN